LQSINDFTELDSFKPIVKHLYLSVRSLLRIRITQWDCNTSSRHEHSQCHRILRLKRLTEEKAGIEAASMRARLRYAVAVEKATEASNRMLTSFGLSSFDQCWALFCQAERGLASMEARYRAPSCQTHGKGTPGSAKQVGKWVFIPTPTVDDEQLSINSVETSATGGPGSECPVCWGGHGPRSARKHSRATPHGAWGSSMGFEPTTKRFKRRTGLHTEK
jgi:hypothetical protein